MSFKVTILTLYPEMFPGHLGHSLAGRALKNNLWQLETVNIRDFALDKHKSVDDTPYGGGAGMVMRPDVLARAIDSVLPDSRPRFLMSPRGQPLTQSQARSIASGEGIIIVCGRFEGVDERVISARNLEEISIGDYILSGGEPAAQILVDSVVRLVGGVMGNPASGLHESFENNLLEHPHYTKPLEFEGILIPDILLSGHHKNIQLWRDKKSRDLTRERRPDLG
jgi:tRNA (guanine37-N1)-methyltransferase